MIRHQGHRVAPLSRANIKDAASKIREAIGNTDGYLDVVKLAEIHMQKGIQDFVFDVVEPKDLPAGHLAITKPDQLSMQVAEEVYNGAISGLGFHRFTIAHEIGHLFLHRNQAVYSRKTSIDDKPLKPYEDSEWQADEFAAELLMPSAVITDRCMSAQDIAVHFGVSNQAAETRFRALQKQK